MLSPMRRALVLTALLLTSGLLPSGLSAATVSYRTDAELIAMSERVVHGRVLRHRFERPGGINTAIYTVTTLAVLEDFTGVPGDTVDVWELGGVSDGEIMFVGGEVKYETGAEVLVCLGRGPFGLRSVAMGFSKFDITALAAPNGAAEGRLTRSMRDTAVFGGAVQANERSLSEFRSLAAAVRGVRPLASAAAGSLIPELDVAEPYTFLTFSNGLGTRWTEADSGIPVRYYRRTTPPSPLQSGNIDTEIQKALSAWTAPTSASITLQYFGAIAVADPNPRTTVTGNGTVLISFEDPNNELTNPVLALGGGFATLSDGGVIGGQTFNRFTNGYVFFQNAADLPASFRQPTNFTRVLEHEVGHTIGLGHSPDTSAIMYASCCLASTPIAPALGSDDLAGLSFIYPVTPSGACSFSLSSSTASIGPDATSGSLTVTAPAGCTWSATTSASFVTLSSSGATGTGPVVFAVSANTSTSQRIATLTVAGQTFTITQAGRLPIVSPPFGVVETPLDNVMGVTGSVPVTGWALDDVQVLSVKVYRDPVAGESGASLVYVGDATFVPGARPDVAAAYPTTPFNTRAGWGYLLLTNTLPNRGTGTYRLSIYATDQEGNRQLLGIRTITCNNSTATVPFGAIDTPAQGEVISSATVNNFGWVLSLGPRRADPPGGGTVRVVVDGTVIGSPSGWTSRSDISALFPASDYPGVNTALGVHTFSTTGLAEGLHTIAWSVTDNMGGVAGIGSRYFSISTSVPDTALAAASSVQSAPENPLSAPLTARVITGRRGFALDSPLRRFPPDSSGVVSIEGEEVDRFELHLRAASTASAQAGTYTGYMRLGSLLQPLPIGSSLDALTGDFSWQPGVGFVGTYDFVFVRSIDGRSASRQDVRIVLNPKASGRVGPQVMIDTLTPYRNIAQPFVLAGWAVDLDDEVGTGVDAIHVWAYPLAGGDPVFLGPASYGGTRPDVAAVYGERFKDSGYSLTVSGLMPGNYDLAVFAWSTITGGFTPAKTVRVTVR
jgi:hypothetical protein